MQRRDVLKLFAGAAVLQLAAAEPGAPLYFSKDEFAALDELTEMIIPADSHSGGAHAAGVATYIDKTVAEAFLPEEKESWRKGLAPFLPLSRVERLKMLTDLAGHEENPKTDSHRFFRQLKDSTAAAYYSSKIGIHDDMQYQGNVIQEQYAGFEAS
jgi:hypothetical protein